MTFSHTPPQLNKLWVLVADRAHARFFKADWPAVEKLAEFEDLVYPVGAVRESDTVSDSPGRFRTHQGHMVSGDSETDFKHHHAEEFGRQIVDKLEHGRLNHEFDRLILIVPPFQLGVLRQQLNPSLAQLVTGEVNKELTKANVKEILEYVREIAEKAVSVES